jgi:hypothetical protein
LSRQHYEWEVDNNNNNLADNNAVVVMLDIEFCVTSYGVIHLVPIRVGESRLDTVGP